MTLGITGHQSLPQPAVTFITERIQDLITAQSAPIVGYSSLARGADQLFARLILNAGGELHVVLPSRQYASTFDAGDLVAYQALLEAAEAVTTLDAAEPNEAAFDAAGRFVVVHSDTVIAVWDGQPSRGLGGTADAVAYARSIDRVVQVVWPPGVRRG